MNPFAAIPDRITEVGALDGVGAALTTASERSGIGALAERARKLLGHSAHPMLVDLPIGFWTSACTLDAMAGRVRGTRRAAELMVAAGVLTAVPAIVSGLGELPGMDVKSRRVAAVHACTNALATALFTASWMARRRGGSGVRSAAAGASVATFGGLLGGWLAFPPSDDDGED